MSDLSDALMGATSAGQAGWARLGANLGSGNQAQQRAFQTGALQGATMSNVMEEARRKRDANLGFSAITADLVKRAQSGDADAIAELQADTAHAGGGNAQQIAESFGTGQKTAFTGQLERAAQNGATIQSLNPGLAVLGGKPVQTTDIKDNTVYDPYGDASQATTPTAIGQSDITRLIAAAQNERAAAGEHTAAAARDYGSMNHLEQDNNGNDVLVNDASGTIKPVVDGSGNPVRAPVKGQNPGQLSDPKPEVLEQALGKPMAGGKPNPEYAAYKTFQARYAATDPAYNNGDYALSQYLSAKQDDAALQKDATNAPTTDADGNVTTPSIASSFSAALAKTTPPSAATNSGDAEPDRDSGLSLSDLITGKGAAPAPSPAPAKTSIAVGQTATNPQTGQKLQWNGNSWVPVNG